VQGGYNPAEPFLLRLIVLILMAACCYGIQVLMEKHRRAEEEAREFAVRQEQLRSAGRLAARIAHQIKNPLAIINNAAYSLQKALEQGKDSMGQQVQIIREEVERSDRIITQLMGYAQLAEGRVEKLNIIEEIERAIAEVFPLAAKYKVTISRVYAPNLPVLVVQRIHLTEILMNLLQNAREAIGGHGHIQVTVQHGPENSLVLSISDSGPGIAKEQLDKVFQPYFSTKEKGTGLGLALVKNNAELYGGSVRVESALGKGARFIVNLPTRIYMDLPK
jgi:signal transduction histidine kinase